MRYLWIVLIFGLSFFIPIREARAAGTAVQNGKHVAFDYTLSVDGKVVDSSEGKKPLEYVQGDGQIIPGLTKKMEGLRAGDERTITVAPEEGYGQVNPKAIQEIPNSAFPPGTSFQTGMQVQAKNANGNAVIMRVVEVKKDSVVMDLNHPLAGKSLTFKVHIVSVK